MFSPPPPLSLSLDAAHRNLISRIGIRTVVGFFTVQWNGASVVGKGKEEKFIFLTK
jgi:hypothetical protein